MYHHIRYKPRQDVREFSQTKFNPVYRHFSPTIKDMLFKSIQAHHGAYSSLNLQAELLGHILVANMERKKYLREKKLYGKKLQGLLEQHATLKKVSKVQNDIDNTQKIISATEWVIRQLRSIGDGIAWRFFNYDRATLRQLAEHDYVSVPEIDRGLKREVDVMDFLKEKEMPSIMNTITNCLRIGDITIYDKQTNEFELIEIKSSKRQTRKIKRQSQHRNMAQKSLRNGYHRINRVPITKRIAKKPLLTYVKSVESAVLEADQKLESSRVFGDYLAVGVFAINKIIRNKSEKDIDYLQNKVLDRCNSIRSRKDDILLPLMTNIFATANFIPSLAPYAIFPIAPECRLNILSGDFWIISQLNISGLARWLQKRGWQTKQFLPSNGAIETDDEIMFQPVLRVSDGGKYMVKGVDVPWDVLALAALEFWMPESIETAISSVIELGFDTQGFHIINFPNTGKYAWD